MVQRCNGKLLPGSVFRKKDWIALSKIPFENVTCLGKYESVGFKDISNNTVRSLLFRCVLLESLVWDLRFFPEGKRDQFLY
jgi:hypothetical protein